MIGSIFKFLTEVLKKIPISTKERKEWMNYRAKKKWNKFKESLAKKREERLKRGLLE